MGLGGVNLLDPNQEPSDDQLGLLMKGFLADVRAKKALSKRVLRDALEDALAKAEERNPVDEAQSPAVLSP